MLLILFKGDNLKNKQTAGRWFTRFILNCNDKIINRPICGLISVLFVCILKQKAKESRCWNIVYTLSITVPWESTILPTSAGSELRKYTSLINVVAACQGKVFMYLTIKTNHIRIRVLRNQIFFFSPGSIPWNNKCFKTRTLFFSRPTPLSSLFIY